MTRNPADPWPSPSVPHLAVPFRIVAGRAAVVEQDTDQEIAQCVGVVLRCPRGFRIERPEFGLDDPTFRMGGADAAEIAEVVAEWEPRAQALVEADTGRLAEAISDVRIRIHPTTQGSAADA